MIIGSKREQVIENIQQAAGVGAFHSKVEVDDPVLNEEQRQVLIRNYLQKRTTWGFRANNRMARYAANTASKLINRNTEIIGLEHVKELTGGAILTSNHFNPLDNTVLRLFSMKMGKEGLYIVSNEENFAMSGWIGYLMNYADTVPVGSSQRYMVNQFEDILMKLLKRKKYVLFYPEQEMWFNYRKPRPLKRGAYYYAAKFNVPVISCFIEIQDLEKMDTAIRYDISCIFYRRFFRSL